MDSDQRTLISQRIHCINCNICVNTCNAFRPQRVLHLDRRVVSLMSNWISPSIVTEDDYICEACFDLAMQTVNAQLTDNSERDRCAGPSRRGHTEVCLVCGRSLANRQSHVILRDQDQAVIQIIQNRLSPRQVSQYDRSCHACWMSARREATRNQQVDEGRVDLPVNTDQNIPFEIQSVIDSVPSHHSRSQPGSPQPVINEQPDIMFHCVPEYVLSI
ncbi:hypothetical protein ACJJTC_002281 [Scirpophaga incertulas]